MANLDLRIVRVGIQVDDQLKVYEGLSIVASGTKYANPLQNECEVKIRNISQETIDYIVSQTSPLNTNKTRRIVTIDTGRESYGVSRIFQGAVVNASVSQPPDVELTLKCLTGNDKKGKIVSKSKPGLASVKAIATDVAKDLDLSLDFQAKDKNVNNYNFSGSAIKQVNALGDFGGIDAYVDDGVLVVKDARVPLSNVITVVNADTGMIGIPELSEQGIKVKFLMEGVTRVGGLLRVTSKRNVAANGDFVVYKLGFEIANRDDSFYWIAEATRLKK